MGLRPAHGFISSVLIFGKLVSAHLINGLTLFHLISVLYPENSAVPAILNLFSPNLAVTIFFSSSNRLTHGELSPGLLIVILYPLTGYIGKLSPILFASFLEPIPAPVSYTHLTLPTKRIV